MRPETVHPLFLMVTVFDRGQFSKLFFFASVVPEICYEHYKPCEISDIRHNVVEGRALPECYDV